MFIRCYLTHCWGCVVIAPPIRFSVVDFSKNGGNHVKVSTSLGLLLLAHLGFLGRPVDLLLQERYTTCSSLLPPKNCIFSCEYTNTYLPRINLIIVPPSVSLFFKKPQNVHKTNPKPNCNLIPKPNPNPWIYLPTGLPIYQHTCVLYVYTLMYVCIHTYR